MKKEYFVNKEYNKKKRKSAIVLGIILTMLLLFMASIFAVNGDYFFTIVFLVLLIVPILSIPSGFKNYPVHNEPIVVIDKNTITANGKTFNFKDIKRILVIIDLPSSKVDKDDLKTLDYLRTAMPEDEFYGTFDIYYEGGKKKTEIEYTTIDHVVDALYTVAEAGFKAYKLRYTIKKNSVVNECDLKKRKEELAKEDPIENLSKRQRKRQLL